MAKSDKGIFPFVGYLSFPQLAAAKSYATSTDPRYTVKLICPKTKTNNNNLRELYKYSASIGAALSHDEQKSQVITNVEKWKYFPEQLDIDNYFIISGSRKADENGGADRPFPNLFIAEKGKPSRATDRAAEFTPGKAASVEVQVYKQKQGRDTFLGLQSVMLLEDIQPISIGGMVIPTVDSMAELAQISAADYQEIADLRQQPPQIASRDSAESDEVPF